jgi:uncharacterized membrane protein YedE/YeeE
MSNARSSATWVGVVTGSLFAVGLTLSGMTNPMKVLQFLDVFGAWDPSLAFVMLGAVGVHFSWLRWIARDADAKAALSLSPGKIDARLLLGAGIFGVGWGLAGYCPGPALVAFGSGRSEAWSFVTAMVCGILLFNAVQRREERPATLREPSR